MPFRSLLASLVRLSMAYGSYYHYFYFLMEIYIIWSYLYSSFLSGVNNIDFHFLHFIILSFLPAVTHKEKERSDRQEPMNPPAPIPFQPFPLRSFLTPFQLLPSLWCEREWSDTERPVNGMDEGSWECRVSRGTSPSHVGCLEVTRIPREERQAWATEVKRKELPCYLGRFLVFSHYQVPEERLKDWWLMVGPRYRLWFTFPFTLTTY